MFKKLQETYGIEFNISEEKKLTGLPMYMLLGRNIYEAEYAGQKFLVVSITDSERFGSIALEKQLIKYQNQTNMLVAYAFKKLTGIQRKALIQRQIPFILEPDQIYLPFLGMMMKKTIAYKAGFKEGKMMPATQSLFLYLLYKDQNGSLKKDAAEYLDLTRTSISRASEQLVEMELIREEKLGKEIRMYPIKRRMEYYQQAKPYLINPVQKRMFVRGNEKIKECPLAGESALGMQTMLSNPDIKVVALYKGIGKEMDFERVDPKWETANDVCEVELWKYDPNKFAIDGIVDPVSLSLALKEENDERIEAAIEEYMEKWKW